MDKPIWIPSETCVECAKLNCFMKFARRHTGNGGLNSHASQW